LLELFSILKEKWMMDYIRKS